MLTRWEDRELVRAAKGLKFLVFDEIHTFRGRQGADVAMLIRRCRHAFGDRNGGTDMLRIGTSATMASEGTSARQREAAAKVSQTLFGVEFSSQQVIGETLERAPIVDILSELAHSECRPAGGAGSRAERLAALRRRCDSRIEERWLENVDSLGLRLPSDAQYRIPQVATRPDFYYRESNAAIYIDGPPHDAPDQIREDDGIAQALMEFGYIVVRFHHASDWLAVFRRHPDIFGIPAA